MGAQDPPETGSQGEALIAGKISAQPTLLRLGGGDRSSKRRRGSRAGNGPPDQRRTRHGLGQFRRFGGLPQRAEVRCLLVQEAIVGSAAVHLAR